MRLTRIWSREGKENPELVLPSLKDIREAIVAEALTRFVRGEMYNEDLPIIRQAAEESGWSQEDLNQLNQMMVKTRTKN